MIRKLLYRWVVALLFICISPATRGQALFKWIEKEYKRYPYPMLDELDSKGPENASIPFYPLLLGDGDYVILYNLTGDVSDTMPFKKLPAATLSIKNGKKHGAVVFYSKSFDKKMRNRIIGRGRYSNDLKNGKWVTYTLNNYGEVVDSSFCNFSDGILNGPYGNGPNKIKGEYKNGKKIGRWENAENYRLYNDSGIMIQNYETFHFMENYECQCKSKYENGLCIGFDAIFSNQFGDTNRFYFTRLNNNEINICDSSMRYLSFFKSPIEIIDPNMYILSELLSTENLSTRGFILSSNYEVSCSLSKQPIQTYQCIGDKFKVEKRKVEFNSKSLRSKGEFEKKKNNTKMYTKSLYASIDSIIWVKNIPIYFLTSTNAIISSNTFISENKSNLIFTIDNGFLSELESRKTNNDKQSINRTPLYYKILERNRDDKIFPMKFIIDLSTRKIDTIAYGFVIDKLFCYSFNSYQSKIIPCADSNEINLVKFQKENINNNSEIEIEEEAKWPLKSINNLTINEIRDIQTLNNQSVFYESLQFNRLGNRYIKINKKPFSGIVKYHSLEPNSVPKSRRNKHLHISFQNFPYYISNDTIFIFNYNSQGYFNYSNGKTEGRFEEYGQHYSSTGQYIDGKLHGIVKESQMGYQNTILYNHGEYISEMSEGPEQSKIFNIKGAFVGPQIFKSGEKIIHCSIQNNKLEGLFLAFNNNVLIDSINFKDGLPEGSFSLKYALNEQHTNQSNNYTGKFSKGRLIDSLSCFWRSGELNYKVFFKKPLEYFRLRYDSANKASLYNIKLQTETTEFFGARTYSDLIPYYESMQENDCKNDNTSMFGQIKNDSMQLVNYNYMEDVLEINQNLNGHYKFYYKNGTLSAEGSKRKNRAFGDWKYYSENGNLYKKIKYESGEFYSNETHDTVKYSGYCWGYAPNGNLIYEGYIVNSEPDVTCATDAPLAFEELFYTAIYDSLGKNILVTNGYAPVIEYNVSGNLHAKGWIVNNKKDSLWRYYNLFGLLNEIGKYKNGLKEGRWLSGDLTGAHFVENACFEDLDSAKIASLKKQINITESFYHKDKLIESNFTTTEEVEYRFWSDDKSFNNIYESKWFWSKTKKRSMSTTPKYYFKRIKFNEKILEEK